MALQWHKMDRKNVHLFGAKKNRRTKSHSSIVLYHAKKQRARITLCRVPLVALSIYGFFIVSQINLLHYLTSNRVRNWIAFFCVRRRDWHDYYWHFEQQCRTSVSRVDGQLFLEEFRLDCVTNCERETEESERVERRSSTKPSRKYVQINLLQNHNWLCVTEAAESYS